MFLGEEMRDGYLITEKQKKIWAIQLEMLKILLDICKKNDIVCFAIWGTLLGAVRHRGFIPWDDDLDIGLARKDFDKLCECVQEELHYPFFFQTAFTDKTFFLPYARLRNSNTTGIITDNWDPEYNNGIFIDIYPLDGICQNTWKRKIQYALKDFYAMWARCYHPREKTKNILKRILIAGLTLSTQFVNYEKICQKHNYWCSLYNTEADEIGLVYHRNLVKNYHFPANNINNITECNFEDLKIPIPTEYSCILKSVYGDYMKFPPINERGKWHKGQIVYDVNLPFKEYFKLHPDKSKIF